VPRTNTEYWTEKIAGNQRRDEHTNTLLRDAGWTVVRVWEHENPEDAAHVVAETVSSARDKIKR
jgi:DNA mismatch endonuclease (patch repair protein)